MPQGQSSADDAVGQKRKANEDVDQATAKKPKSRDALTHNDYTVGWICALPKELTASIAMLDEKHPGLPKPPTDSNAYTLGSIGGHNIVMACLPKGITGNVSAATVARNMANNFPSIKIGLMVGIGGGVPSNKVRLGDVVVSTPTSTFAGVVKWDFGKHHDNKDDFERTGALDHPPQSLLTALTLLEAQQNLEGTKIPTYLEEVKKKWPMLASKFLRNDTLKDVLFKASYSHVKKSTLGGEAGGQESEDEDEDEEHESCHLCDKSMTVKRPPRDMVVHYGLIASGDGLIKGATARNKLNKDLGGHVLCIEMEAAGVMNHFPCLVIRGICDYADSHKNKYWQEHAAIVAAAFAKELLQHVQADDIQRERPIKDIIQDVDINSLYASHKEKGKRPERQDIFKALQNVVAQHSKVYLIVDALDEYGPSGSSRESFLSLLRELQRRHKINVLMTSRFDMRIIAEIDSIFGNVIKLEILGSTEDIARYVEHSLSILPSAMKGNRSLKDDIIKKISESAKGMFLLAQMYLKLLSYKTSETEMRRQLTAFQKHGNEDGIADALTKAYKETMDRINQQQPDHIILAKRVLLWIARAKRELTVQELQHALAMSSVQREPCEADLPFDETLVTVCAGLVAVDEAKKTIQLVHYTVQEYINQRPCQLLPVTELDLARACIAYLSFSSFEGGYYDRWDGMEDRLKPYPFYHYAAKNWGHHARDSSISVDELIEHFNPGTQLMKSVCVLLVRESSIPGTWYWPKPPRSTSRLHIAAYFGLENIVQKLLLTCSQADLTDDYNRTPLSYAAEQGYETVIELLIDNGADKDSQGTDEYEHEGRTPLSFAAEKGHEAAARTLINQKASLHLACGTRFERGLTPLSYATRCGHMAVVTLLLESGAELEYDNSGRTALSRAAERGHKDIAILLLQKGANPDLRMTCSEQFGRTALSFAAENGHQDVVQLLLNASTNELDHDDVVQLLLERGANIDSGRERTPLSYAAENGHSSIVGLLLEIGANADSKATGNLLERGRTPLSLAAEKGHSSVVQLLLEAHVDIDSKATGSSYHEGRTPLSFASGHGHSSVVELLLQRGAAVDSRTECDDREGGGRTPLSYAASNGHLDVVRMLLHKWNANSDAADDIGRTPLSYAAESGHAGIVQELVKTGASLETRSTSTYWGPGQTPLHFAVGSTNRETIQVLVESGADVNSKDDEGRTPFFWAIGFRDIEIFQILQGSNTEKRAADVEP
ncbi:hypothetical protein FVER53263_20921 [Fusarium verticillioides]|nr:hypothetical protein FVER53263_20921 [Fusarium verticillioides]